MKTDEWHSRNRQDNNRHLAVEIKLKDGRTLKGMIAGYFKENMEDENAEIVKWHVVDEKDYMSMGIDSFGFLIGEIVDYKDIEMIIFKEN